MDGVQVEKRGCIWLVRLLSPNTCTPSTQQPTRHPLSQRLPCAERFSPIRQLIPLYLQQFFSKTPHTIMGNLLSHLDGVPEMLLVHAFVYLSHLSPLNRGRSLPNLGLGLWICRRGQV
jgi:hypothetical protein